MPLPAKPYERYEDDDYDDIDDIGRVEYAGFWLRFVAAILDGLILWGINFVVNMIVVVPVVLFTQNIGRAGDAVALEAGIFIQTIDIVIGWLYEALQESSAAQATLGKRALGIKVTDMNGDRISFGRATGRHFAKIISALTLFIGFIMAGTTEKKQALHDIIAGCLVIKGESEPRRRRAPDRDEDDDRYDDVPRPIGQPDDRIR